MDLCGSAPADRSCVAVSLQGLVESDPLDRCGSASTRSSVLDTNGTYESTDRRTLYLGNADQAAFKAKVKISRSKSLIDYSGGLITTDFSPFAYAVRATGNSPTGWNGGNIQTVPGVADEEPSEPAYACPVEIAAQNPSARRRCPAYSRTIAAAEFAAFTETTCGALRRPTTATVSSSFPAPVPLRWCRDQAHSTALTSTVDV